jgi:uncharacterized protein YyaL (SSP411 family)
VKDLPPGTDKLVKLTILNFETRLFRLFIFNASLHEDGNEYPMQNKRQQKDEIARIKGFIEIDKNTLPPDGGPLFNRLIFSKSPYLLQHADNPVNWYPWSEEAFAKARMENKPVFLSIGYSTCHWCHVMEEESFGDREVAAVMNKHVVPIKVDREERPDIDAQYMKVAQMMTGSGGWPLNIIMTPERKPFFAATYIPRRARMGLPGIIELIEKVSELWQSGRNMIEQTSEKILGALKASFPTLSERPEDRSLLDRAYRDIEGMFDPLHGGFGGAPKFPMPLYISFLLRHFQPDGSSAAREMVDRTLRSMRAGGIFDQVGFGFHRYSVDREWFAPHFEKMLYDQALIAIAYLEAFQSSGDVFFKDVAREIFEFVLREMSAPDGGFCSGLDADSEGEEGRYYLWTPEEVNETLGRDLARLYCGVYDVTDRGNFEGRSIPHLQQPLERHTSETSVTTEELANRLEEARGKLLQRREKRIRPFRDEKVLTSWNGLMIAALAKGSQVIGDERFVTAAEKAAAFVLEKLCTTSGRLLRSYHLGEASVPAFLEDYAFFTLGLTELYQTTGKSAYLNDALRLTGEMTILFRDEAQGGFFDTGSDAEEVLVRMKSSHDDVIPSGNSVAALNLLRLGKITADDALLREGSRTLQAFMEEVGRFPSAYPQMLVAFDYSLGPDVDITLAYTERDSELMSMLRLIAEKHIPNLVMRLVEGGDEAAGYRASGGKTTAYVCAAGACRPPAVGAEELKQTLAGVLRNPNQQHPDSA